MVGVIAAPAVVKSSILMPVKKIIMPDGIALKTMSHPILTAEILRATREAFIPKLQMQIYTPNPSWLAIINK
jgi:hypothetical protein